VLQHCAGDPGKVAAYFYFDFNDPQKQSPELMMKSLISQISHQLFSIPAALEMLFSSCENGQRQPSTDALLDVLRKILQEFPESYLILDALDECSERHELLRLLEGMASWRLPRLHLMLTSRKERDIETSLSTFVGERDAICLEHQKVDQDIRSYVLQRLQNDSGLKKWNKDPKIRQEIENALMSGAHGM
jgi:hypothetical protein